VSEHAPLCAAFFGAGSPTAAAAVLVVVVAAAEGDSTLVEEGWEDMPAFMLCDTVTPGKNIRAL